MSDQRELRKVAQIYRIGSLLMSSVLYAFFVPTGTFFLKILVLSGMSAACALELLLYQDDDKTRKNHIILAWGETVWNSLFLCLSGGLFSPYIWYCVSAVIAIGMELTWIWSICVAVGYFLIASAAVFFWQLPYEPFYGKILVGSGFALLSAVIIALIYYVGKMEREQTKLQFLLSIHDSSQLIDELVRYMNQVLNTSSSMWIFLDDKGKIKKYNSQNMDRQMEEELIHIAQKKKWDSIQTIESEIITLNASLYCLSFFAYNTNCRGIYIYLGKSEGAIIRRRYMLYQYLQILLNLLKKQFMEEISEELLVRTEQNRIAGEIHDIVLQKLFAVSCSLYLIKQKTTDETIVAQMEELKQTIDHAMRELRETIYDYHWEKRGEEPFAKWVEDYIREIQKLHQVHIDFCMHASTQALSLKQKTSIYRIICETINNAVRHGKADRIGIELMEEKDSVVTIISDNGIGFTKMDPKRKHFGVGIHNINELAKSCHGTVKMETGESQGTVVCIRMPVI